LNNVYLSGVDCVSCPSCGQECEIPAVEELMSALARAIVQKSSLLTGSEIRFLRKRIGKKATEFSRLIGVRPEEVSRWENGSHRPEKSACRLMRLTYAQLSGDKKLRETIVETEYFEQ